MVCVHHLDPSSLSPGRCWSIATLMSLDAFVQINTFQLPGTGRKLLSVKSSTGPGAQGPVPVFFFFN